MAAPPLLANRFATVKSNDHDRTSPSPRPRCPKIAHEIEYECKSSGDHACRRNEPRRDSFFLLRAERERQACASRHLDHRSFSVITSRRGNTNNSRASWLACFLLSVNLFLGETSLISSKQASNPLATRAPNGSFIFETSHRLFANRLLMPASLCARPSVFVYSRTAVAANPNREY